MAENDENEIQHMMDIDQKGSEIESYPLMADTRGYCVIFDNYKFEDAKNNRKGSKIDREKFEEVFKFFNYEIQIEKNLKANQIIQRLNGIRKMISLKHLKYNLFVAIFLSHGKQSLIRGTDLNNNEAYVYIRNIMNIFSEENCPSLTEIPKIFIISACRGGKRDNGILYTPSNDDTALMSDHDFDPKFYHKNFLVCYSTIFDHKSIRSKTKGTWFGSILSSNIRKYSKNHEFEYILKLSQRDISKKEGKMNGERRKQSISWFANNVSKRIFLTEQESNDFNYCNDDKYLMPEKNKGHCLIFDNYDFEKGTIKQEFGSHQEKSLFAETFEYLGFNVEHYSKKTADDIRKIIDLMKSKKCSAFVAVFLSHGDQSSIMGSDDSPILMSEIVRKLSNSECKNLIGKPKILILSPIYGETNNDLSDDDLSDDDESDDESDNESDNESDTYEDVLDDDDDDTNLSDIKDDDMREGQIIPTFGDTILCYSLIKDEGKLRSPIYGTFYGSVFKSIIIEHSKTYHFEDMLKLIQIETHKGTAKLSDNSEVVQSTCWEAMGLSKLIFF